MAKRSRLYAILTLAMTLSAPAMAQEVIDNYVAVIGAQDRFNSSGTALSQPEQILAQDRANFHRFGIRQPGDTEDRSFRSTEERTRFGMLLSNGTIDPAAAQAILGGQNVPVLVEVLGSGGRATGLRVSLAGGQLQQQQGLPRMTAQVPTDLSWQFGRYPAGPVSVVSADLYRNSDLLVSLRCIEAQGATSAPVAGIDPSPGMLTMHLAPQVTGAGTVGQTVNAELALGPAGRTAVPLDWRAPPGAYSASLVLVPGFAALLAEGRVAVHAGAQSVDFVGSAGLAEVMPQLSQACMSQATVAATGCANMLPGADLTQCILPRRVSGAGPMAALGLPQPGGAQPQTVAAPVPAETDGNDAVQAAIFGWALAQHPVSATVPQYQQLAPRMALPPDAPVPPQSGVAGPDFEAFLRSLAAYYANRPAPSRIRIEFPATVRRDEMRDGFRLYSSGRDIEGVHALTDLSLAVKQLNSDFIWKSRKPFYLPLPQAFVPPDLESGRDVRNQLMLSVVLTMSNPVVEERGGLFRSITSDAEIEHVSLILRSERRVQGKYLPEPDRLVTSWTRETGARVTASAPRPTDPAGMVAVFGGAISAGRYVPEWDTHAVKGRALGAATGILNNGQQTRSIESALAFGALLAAGPERAIGPEAAGEAIRNVLTEREAFDLFPVAYLLDPDSMNEIERRVALEEAQPGLRAILSNRMPQLPLQVRDVIFAMVLDYDFTLKGFPLNGQGGRWGPKDPLTGQEIRDLVPAFLPMPEAEASTLLKMLEQRGELPRTLFVAVDYTLTDAALRAAVSGPISPAELGLVRLGSRIDAVTIFADPGLTIPVAQTVTGPPPDEIGPNLLPDALFATTGKSLLGAMGQFPGGEAAIGAEVSYMRDVARVPADQRPRLVASIVEDIVGTGRDEYWIGAHWQLRGFDADAGGYPVKAVSFRGVPHSDDISGFDPPSMQGEASHAYEVLRIDPARRAEFEAYLDLNRAGHVDGMRLTSNIRVRPVGLQEGRSGAALVVSAPLEIMLGQSRGSDNLLTDDDRFLIAAPPKLGPGAEGAPQIVPPDVLMLDHEGIDLLTVGIAPEAYDDAAYARMLVERLLKERALAGAVENEPVPHAVDWGRFFENPTQRLTQPEIARLVPIFREWTQARAAQLPDRVAIPLSFDMRYHPETGCLGMTEVNASAVGRRDNAAYDGVAMHMPDANLPDSVMPLGSSGPSRAGPDRFWVAEGRALIGNTRSDCGYVRRQIGRGSDITALVDAPYADALVRIRRQPTPQGGARYTSATYIGALDEVSFVPASPSGKDGPGLVGILSLSATPLSLTGQHRNNIGEVEFADPLGPDDWKVPVAVAPKALDVVGLTLEMPLAEFERAVREKIPDAVVFEPSNRVAGLFGAAKGFLNPDTQEAFLGIFAPALEGQPIIGIVRQVDVSTDRATPAALRRSLEVKYGSPSLTQGERYMLWGTLPEGEDQLDFCGGLQTVSRGTGSDVPQMRTRQMDRFENEYSLPRHGFWAGAGWPQDRSDGPDYAMKDPERCGPVVAATLSEHDRGTLLGVLLFDRKLAERQRDAPPVEAEVEAADIDL